MIAFDSENNNWIRVCPQIRLLAKNNAPVPITPTLIDQTTIIPPPTPQIVVQEDNWYVQAKIEICTGMSRKWTEQQSQKFWKYLQTKLWEQLKNSQGSESIWT